MIPAGDIHNAVAVGNLFLVVEMLTAQVPTILVQPHCLLQERNVVSSGQPIMRFELITKSNDNTIDYYHYLTI